MSTSHRSRGKTLASMTPNLPAPAEVGVELRAPGRLDVGRVASGPADAPLRGVGA